MGDVNDWNVTDANNNAAPPDGWPENTMQYSEVNNTGRQVQGAVKRMYADLNGSLAAGGSANAYTLTLNAPYTAYFDGMMFSCSMPATNTGATTLNVNGIGAATVVDNGGALSGGELVSGGVYTFMYNGTNLVLVNPELASVLRGQVEVDTGIFAPLVNNSVDLGTLAYRFAELFISALNVYESAAVPGTVGGGYATFWGRNDTPTQPMFTDDAGTDWTLGWVSAPASSSASGNAGDKAYDSSYLYVCYATDSWARIAWGSTSF